MKVTCIEIIHTIKTHPITIRQSTSHKFFLVHEEFVWANLILNIMLMIKYTNAMHDCSPN